MIRFIGLSNFSLNQVIEAQGALKKYEVASIQMPYSLMDRRIEADIIPYAKKNGMAVIAYYPLGHGRLIREFPRDALEVIARNHGPKTVARWCLIG